MSIADSYDPIEQSSTVLDYQPNLYEKVWSEAVKLRCSGKLLSYGKNITCPVCVIHGDYDPHPFNGVKEPLSRVIANIDFILLKNCGHEPWVERQARKFFFKILKEKIE